MTDIFIESWSDAGRVKGIVPFEVNFWLPQGHPRCSCLCFRSSL